MPIEIRDLVVNVNVTPSKKEATEKKTATENTADQAEILEACTQHILKIINDKKER